MEVYVENGLVLCITDEADFSGTLQQHIAPSFYRAKSKGLTKR
jgi:hypothetical protein